jgi:N-terminal acetyltransferase B complex non-catalytic subunit
MDINYFEILHRNQHLTGNKMVTDSLHKGHTHGLLLRAVMAVDSAKAPKKGKVPKLTEEIAYRCQSLTRALVRATHCLQGSLDVDSIDGLLWKVFSSLCDVIRIVLVGESGTENDTLFDRENAAVGLLEAAVLFVNRAQETFNGGGDERGILVCQLLPSCIVPIYTMIETTARLFALFGWGKRKLLTKVASGALAGLARSFRSLVSDLLRAMTKHRRVKYDMRNEKLLVRADAFKRAVNEVTQSREMTKDRVDAFLEEIMHNLTSYEDEE